MTPPPTLLEQKLRHALDHARGEHSVHVSIPCDWLDLVLEVLATRREMCFWPWNHIWTPWATIERGSHQRRTDELGTPLPNGEVQTVGYFERQRRNCRTCEKIQLRKVSA